VAFISKLIALLATRNAFCAITAFILLLRGDASYGKPQGIGFKMNWLGQIEVSQHESLGESIE
jgi:hypothetical protein